MTRKMLNGTFELFYLCKRPIRTFILLVFVRNKSTNQVIKDNFKSGSYKIVKNDQTNERKETPSLLLPSTSSRGQSSPEQTLCGAHIHRSTCRCAAWIVDSFFLFVCFFISLFLYTRRVVPVAFHNGTLISVSRNIALSVAWPTRSQKPKYFSLTSFILLCFAIVKLAIASRANWSESWDILLR